VAVDIRNKKKIVSMEVTSEEVYDGGNMLKNLVQHVSYNNNNVKRVLADGTHMITRRENFQYLSNNGVGLILPSR
jgi:hypothetical protein